MGRYGLLLTFLLFMSGSGVKAQELAYSPGYQGIMVINPAVTGSEGDGHLRISYLNLYPGNSFNLHSALVSYDGYLPGLHGGAGFFVSNDYLGGIVNDLRGGFSYSYYFQADRNLWFSAGLSASFYHRGFNMNGAVLPDQIDPLGGSVRPSGELLVSEGRTVFDIGAGFVFYSGRFSGGLAVDHLTEPDLSLNNGGGGNLNRKLFMHLAGDFTPGGKLFIKPLGTFGFQKGYLYGSAGSALATDNISMSSVFIADNLRNLDIQAGISVNVSVVSVFYNYRFNILQGENMLPFTLYHHTGMALRLYNVDKRKTVKTIKFPIL